jgi:hypothetical protein
MTEEPLVYPLVMALMKRSRLPWRWIMVIAAVLLLLFLILAAYLDGVFSDLSHWSLWRNFLDGPVLIIYLLVAYPFVWRLWWRSVLVLQSLLPIDEGNSNRVEVEVPLTNRRLEWVAILIGAVFWLSLWQPWSRSWESGTIWLSAYDVATQTILFSLLGWLIYSSFVGNWYLHRSGRQSLNMDIFDTGILTPIARSSLGFSLAFIGGISLSLVFQTQEDLLTWNNIIVYVILVCFTIPLFFLSMWSAHSIMAKAKQRELDLVQQHLKAASRELRERMSQSELLSASELSSTIAVIVSYERRIREAPSWPFNASIIGRLLASIVVPAGVYLIKIISGLGIRFQ